MEAKLISLLNERGRTQAGALALALNTSRATLMRAVRASGDALVVRGQARRTAYAARRALGGSLAPLPIFRVDAHGEVHEVARLHLLNPAPGCALDVLAPLAWPAAAGDDDGWCDALPYFLSCLLPQGFMGVQFARRQAAGLGLPESPSRWTPDDALWAASQAGDDAPGDLILGEAACRRWLGRLAALRLGDAQAGIADEAVASAYPALATQALDGAAANAWLAGAQPKFTALRVDDAGRQPRHVVVKFAQAGSAADQRRADLLVCEHLALAVVAEDLGLATAASALVHAGDQVFLEVARSDRVGMAGRAPCVAWSALPPDVAARLAPGGGGAAATARRSRSAPAGEPPAAMPGATPLSGAPTPAATTPAAPPPAAPSPAASSPGAPAPATAAAMTSDPPARASYPPAQAVAVLRAFRQLIGHDADDDLLLRPESDRLVLAPVSSLRPAAYAPQGGAVLPDAPLRPALPLPAEREAWQIAARAARRFWQLAARDRRISEAFRPVCIANALQLRALVT